MRNWLSGFAPAFSEAVTSGPILLGMLAAAVAGLVSFASPCVVPLVPGYLSYLAGLVGAEAPPASTRQLRARQAAGAATKTRARRAVVGSTFLFILGFTAVFVAFTVSVLGLTSTLALRTEQLQRIGGVVTIVMGLVFIGFVAPLQRERRFSPIALNSWVGAPLLGAVFGFGWVPCMGPTLSAVISVSAGTQGMTAAKGALMVIAYCLGLGVPFLVLAWGSARALTAVEWLRRHSRKIQIIGGIAMILVGVLLVTGLWGTFVDKLRIDSTVLYL